MMEPTSRRLALATGLTYHVLEWDAAPGAAPHTVLLLHGFLDFARSWERVVAAGLSGGPLRLIAPDFRGHGDSDRVGPGGYYHFVDYLADLDDLIQQVMAQPGGGGYQPDAGRLSIVGHSMGGSVAAYYAGAFPERVHRLALLEGLGPPEDPQPVPDRVRTWIAAWRRARAARPRGYTNAAAAAARLRAHDPLLDEEQALWLAERGAAPSEDGLWRFKHDPLHVTPGPLPFRVEIAESFWRRITCPVLLIEGEVSVFRLAPEEQRRRLLSLRDQRHAIIPGAGHMMQRHQPAVLARLLYDFLTEG